MRKSFGQNIQTCSQNVWHFLHCVQNRVGCSINTINDKPLLIVRSPSPPQTPPLSPPREMKAQHKWHRKQSIFFKQARAITSVARAWLRGRWDIPDYRWLNCKSALSTDRGWGCLSCLERVRLAAINLGPRAGHLHRLQGLGALKRKLWRRVRMSLRRCPI